MEMVQNDRVHAVGRSAEKIGVTDCQRSFRKQEESQEVECTHVLGARVRYLQALEVDPIEAKGSVLGDIAPRDPLNDNP